MSEATDELLYHKQTEDEDLNFLDELVRAIL